MSVSLARRYVQPLFEVACDQDALDDVAADLRSLGEALSGSPELRGFLAGPTIARSAKRAALDAIFKDAAPCTRNFLRVVIEKSRTDILLLASRLFDDLVRAHRGFTHGVVESAVPVDESAFSDIESAVAKRFGGKVSLERKVEPRLIGGVRVQVGNSLLDASIRGRLEKLKGVLAGE